MPSDLPLFLPLSVVPALPVCAYMIDQRNMTSVASQYQFTVAPNPVVAWLSVPISTPKLVSLQLMLTDPTGRLCLGYLLPIQGNAYFALSPLRARMAAPTPDFPYLVHA